MSKGAQRDKKTPEGARLSRRHYHLFVAAFFTTITVLTIFIGGMSTVVLQPGVSGVARWFFSYLISTVVVLLTAVLNYLTLAKFNLDSRGVRAIYLALPLALSLVATPLLFYRAVQSNIRWNDYIELQKRLGNESALDILKEVSKLSLLKYARENGGEYAYFLNFISVPSQAESHTMVHEVTHVLIEHLPAKKRAEWDILTRENFQWRIAKEVGVILENKQGN